MIRSHHAHHVASIIVELVRAIAGIALTTIAAGPTLSVFLFGGLALYSPVAPIILSASLMTSTSIALPAALINATVLSLLARYRADALPISLVSGAFVGLWARSLVVHDSLGAAATTSANNPEELLAFGATGALMGALYWLIAILPRRHRRLAREAVDSQNFDHAVQDAIKRKRDRRIPWDGRVPPTEDRR